MPRGQDPRSLLLPSGPRPMGKLSLLVSPSGDLKCEPSEDSSLNKEGQTGTQAWALAWGALGI